MLALVTRFLVSFGPIQAKDCPHFFLFFLFPAIVVLKPEVISSGATTLESIAFLLAIVVYVATVWYINRRRSVHIVDFTCYDPPNTCRVPHAAFEEHSYLLFHREEERHLADFHIRVLHLSGLGEETALPPLTHYVPLDPTLDAAREEAEMIMFSSVECLLKKTRVQAEEIDVVIVNCSVFAPNPSLADMLVNKFQFREDVKCINLSGMGCSAEFVALDAARAHLQVHHESRALVVSAEIITPICYSGKDRSMMVSNCLFRMGGAAVLLSNRSADRARSKYSLNHLVRTHIGADDNAFNCVGLREDNEGQLGMMLSKDLPRNAAKALEINIRMFGPIVLPISEKLRYVLNLLVRKLYNPKRAPYVPNFKQVFDHFCIHAGGVPLIDQIEKSLRLMPLDVEASRMTLYRIGNTSSSSVWYELSYIEAKGRMKKGDRVWQIALGGGFKCISADWKCNRSISPESITDGPWPHCIHKLPVELHKIQGPTT
ncbi:3-ketoacyl-CoA synthase 5-like [Aristolochia californica]|uniref:3-ketoacyl-CoA synthase 5-like n=1 Tax=Aristolochia californica TaxID=171875 RepID=UPI0035DB243D